MGPPHTRRPGVLIVDDSRDNRELLAHVLREAGFSTWGVASGEEAIVRADPRIVDVIVLDIVLPGIDGFETCKQLKSTAATALIPVLHLSGVYRDASVKARALESGADAYLTKPVDPLELAATVRALMRLRRAETEARTQAQIIDEIHESVIITDLEGTIVTWNRGAERLFGYSADEMRGRAITILYADPIPPREQFLRTLIATGWHETELRVRCRGGSRWVHLSRSVLKDDHGRATQVIGYAFDVTARRAAMEALRESEVRARYLAQRLQVAQEEERRRIAAEIHDELGQRLTGMQLDVCWVAARIADPETHERLHALARRIDETVDHVRRIASELRPPVLMLGLPAALEWQVSEFQVRTGLPCRVCVRLDAPLDADRSLALFRVCQEALTNVARHARATTVTVSLDDDGACVALTVQDDGVGLGATPHCGGRSLGIWGMRERLRAFDGELDLTSECGRGTTLRARLPRQPKH